MNVTPPGGPLTGRTFVMPQPRDVVAGKYTIVRVLGEGGMGIVYEATHQRLRQRVALKMLLPAMLEHDVIVSRFEREARAAAQLRNRHCVRVIVPLIEIRTRRATRRTCSRAWSAEASCSDPRG